MQLYSKILRKKLLGGCGDIKQPKLRFLVVILGWATRLYGPLAYNLR